MKRPYKKFPVLRFCFVLTLALASGIALPVLAPFAHVAFAAEQPNVVIMLSDNVGYGDIGAYGAGEVRGMPTPRISNCSLPVLPMTCSGGMPYTCSAKARMKSAPPPEAI